MRKSAELPWSVPVALHEIPETGRRFDLAPDERVRTAVAKLAGLRSLPRFEAGFDVRRYGREGLRVTGEVRATVGQVCVVTLEPMDNEIADPVDVIFSPTAAASATVEAGSVPADAPEPLVGGSVDLGAIAIEFLLLGIDPYPRKPDAVFDSPATDDGSAKPFAALAALKKEPQRDR